MQKLKPMMPTLRERKRYVVYRVLSKRHVKKDLSSDIIVKLRSLLGVFDSASAGVLNVEYNQAKQKGILRVSHTSLDKVRAGLAMLSMGAESLIQVIGVSGTLNVARKKYML